MKATVQHRARELGFDACRVTAALPPASASYFEKWLAAGCHGEMAYLARNAHKRIDPARVLAEARSIITLAVSYATASIEPSYAASGAAPLPAPRGLVARYAQYRDYHEVLAEPLRALTALVNELGGPSTCSLWYTDTGPFLERDLAQRAGIGFVGKHTSLVSRELGNWFFLAEIITTAEFPPDAPEPNRCGSCTRCLAACPTQAITAPFQLDARRCISYLTIELKGSIPVELRPAIGARIYGCDDCLAVCPWNRFAQEGRLMRAHYRSDLDFPNMLELLNLDNAAFKRRFADSPILRTKRRGLLRNVAVALGNLGDARALPALTRATSDPEPLVAEHAQWAIGQIEASLKSRGVTF